MKKDEEEFELGQQWKQQRRRRSGRSSWSSLLFGGVASTTLAMRSHYGTHCTVHLADLNSAWSQLSIFFLLTSSPLSEHIQETANRYRIKRYANFLTFCNIALPGDNFVTFRAAPPPDKGVLGMYCRGFKADLLRASRRKKHPSTIENTRCSSPCVIDWSITLASIQVCWEAFVG
jgi:hypothetical protein